MRTKIVSNFLLMHYWVLGSCKLFSYIQDMECLNL